MNDTVLIQQIYPDMLFAPMLDLTRARNEAYCQKWAIDFQCLIGGSRYTNPNDGAWSKVELIQKALADGYDYVIWLDADAMIKDLDTDLREGCVNGIGVCWHRIPQLNHWNVGVLYFLNTPEVKQFIDEWIEKYDEWKVKQWREQGAFNTMAMKSKVVQTISDRWNATLNYSMVPDAVVLGFHGDGLPPERFEKMKEALSSIEKAETEPGLAEVQNG